MILISLRKVGLNAKQVEAMGGTLSTSRANASFVEGTEGYKVLSESGVPVPNPRAKPWIESLPEDERAIVAEIDKARKAKSEGLGDIVAKMIESIGLDRAAKLYEKITGKSCGCDARRKWLNRWWPY